MAVPMKSGGMSSLKVIIFVILSGVTTGIGAFFGSLARFSFARYNCNVFSLCCRSNAIYCIR